MKSRTKTFYERIGSYKWCIEFNFHNHFLCMFKIIFNNIRKKENITCNEDTKRVVWIIKDFWGLSSRLLPIKYNKIIMNVDSCICFSGKRALCHVLFRADVVYVTVWTMNVCCIHEYLTTEKDFVSFQA